MRDKRKEIIPNKKSGYTQKTETEKREAEKAATGTEELYVRRKK